MNFHPPSRIPRYHRILPALCLLFLIQFLIQCAPRPRLAVAEGELPRSWTPADSLQARLELTAYDGRRKSTFNAQLYLRPLEAYKMDFTGPLGVTLGSFFWRDSAFSLVVHDERRVYEGRGLAAVIPGMARQSVSIHSLLGVLWGGFPLHQGDLPAEGERRVELPERGEVWRLRYSPEGRLSEAEEQGGGLKVVYRGWAVHAGRPLPSRLEVTVSGKPILDIDVLEARSNPTWRRSPFFQPYPRGYEVIPLLEDPAWDPGFAGDSKPSRDGATDHPSEDPDAE